MFTFLEFRALFERYGRVVEADVMTDKNFGFVHVDAGMGKSRIPVRKYFELKRNVYFRLRKY